jgi:hypothetical protein
MSFNVMSHLGTSGGHLQKYRLSAVTSALDGAITIVSNQHTGNPCLFGVIHCEISYFVQEYEDKCVKKLSNRRPSRTGDGSAKLKARHEPLSFEDGMMDADMCLCLSDFNFTGRFRLTGWPPIMRQV